MHKGLFYKSTCPVLALGHVIASLFWRMGVNGFVIHDIPFLGFALTRKGRLVVDKSENRIIQIQPLDNSEPGLQKKKNYRLCMLSLFTRILLRALKNAQKTHH